MMGETGGTVRQDGWGIGGGGEGRGGDERLRSGMMGETGGAYQRGREARRSGYPKHVAEHRLVVIADRPE